MLSILSCICCLAVCLLWKNICRYLQILCKFLNQIISYLVVWVLNIWGRVLTSSDTWLANIFSHFCRLTFHFVDGFLCCAKAFLVWCLLTCLFFLLLLLFLCQIKKLLPRPISESLLPVYSSRSFVFSGIMFKGLLHFELIWCIIYDCGWVSFFCVWLFSFPNTIYWRELTNVYSWLFYCTSFDCVCVEFFSPLNSLFCSINLCVYFYAKTILFWLLKFCNIIWNQEVWCFQLCSSFSRSFWLFVVFCGSI